MAIRHTIRRISTSICEHRCAMEIEEQLEDVGKTNNVCCQIQKRTIKLSVLAQKYSHTLYHTVSVILSQCKCQNYKDHFVGFHNKVRFHN